MKTAVIFGLVALFLATICQSSNADLQDFIVPPRFRRSPQDNQAKVYVEKHGSKPATLNANVNRQLYDDGRHSVNANAGVSSPDLRHFNPGGQVNYEYRPQKHVVFSAKTAVEKAPNGRPDGQIHAGLGIEW